MPHTMLGWTIDELASESAGNPFDCVIVGGGSAGLTTARTLAESGRRVAILEAGPAPFLTHISNTELRFNRALSDDIRNQVQYSQKLPDNKPFGPNFGCLGGRGLFWNGAAPRFRAHDFDGWPFTSSDLESEYAWAEQEFRVTGRLGESRLGTEIIKRLKGGGIDAVPAPFAADVGPIGEGRLSSGIASGLGIFFRASGAAVVGGSIRVAVGAQVKRVLLAGNVARGVSASSGVDGNAKEILGRSVVLAGGCIESARLAALSAVPDDSGRIGAGIQDHLFYRCYFEGAQLYDKSKPESAAVFVASTAQDTEQFEIHGPGRRLFAVDDGTVWNPAAGEAYQFMIRSFAATEKRDANRLEAIDGPLGGSIVHFTYSAADEARKASIKQSVGRVGQALGMTLADERFSGPGGSFHEAGGLDMGVDSLKSVTNPEGCFHKVNNLVSVDAASWPRIGATNPHLTIIAVARRQALRLAARLSNS